MLISGAVLFLRDVHKQRYSSLQCSLGLMFNGQVSSSNSPQEKSLRVNVPKYQTNHLRKVMGILNKTVASLK